MTRSWLLVYQPASIPGGRRRGHGGMRTTEVVGDERDIDIECERISLANGGVSIRVEPK